MTRFATPIALIALIGLTGPAWAKPPLDNSTCQSSGATFEGMERAKAASFATLDTSSRANMATLLANCLGHPDSDIRDGLAYEGLTILLRSGTLGKDDTRILRDQLLSIINTDDPEGFSAPFAALVLSEIARTDRVDSYLTDTDRTELVDAAATYVTEITDYRGFSDAEGWRHGVAHGADWMMQLSLNPALTDDHADSLLGAIRAQVPAGGGHAYIHGEPGRLARPVLFIARNGDLAEQDWTDWLAPLVDPEPMSDWGEAYKSEVNLARLHNVKAFLHALYVNASASSNTEVKALILPVTEALQSLP